MDKLYLREIFAIDTWQPDNQLETFLFDELACEENILETKELLSAIDKAAMEMENYCIKNGQELYREVEKSCNTKDFTKFWENSHQIITNLPSNCPELRKMLILRGKTFHEYQFTENAIRDFEICVYLGQQNNILYLEELVNLIECYYEIGEFEKFEQSCNLFRREYSKELKIAKSKRSMKKNSSRLVAIKQYENKISKFDQMSKSFKNKIHSKFLGETYDESKFMPYQGFKASLDERISSASVACTLIPKQLNDKNYDKIVANRTIPLGEIIAFERPLDREFFTPLLHCENCHQLNTILYSCFDCHQKYYCCLECLRNDANLHQYECRGLRNGLLHSMEATMLFRMLIKCLTYIKKYIFCTFWKAPDVNDFFELIVDNIKFGPQAKIKKLMTNFDNYATITESEIFTMATYALRIAVYAVDKTSILEDFFINIEFEKHDLLIFLASLILRLENQIKINSVELSYIILHPENVSNKKIEFYQSEVFHPEFLRKNDSQTIFEYCNYSKEEASEEAFQLIMNFVNETKFQSDFRRLKIQLPVKVTRKFMNQAYIDNVGDAEHEFTLEQKLNIALRATREILHLRMYTYNSNLSSGTSAVTVQSAYPTITKLKHSCDSNAVPILLESGALIVKAGKNILQGEEITLTYLAEYKSYPNFVRKQLQAYLKFRCRCKFCNNNIDFWETNNSVICYNCHKPIFGAKCETCDIEKLKLCTLYEEICKSVRNTATRSSVGNDEVRTLKYLILLDQIQSLMFTQSHENNFLSNFEIALTCVQKNFVNDAYELLKSFYYRIPVVFMDWNFQNVVYLTMLLDKLICLLQGNISYNKSFVRHNLCLFYDIWKLANEVAKKLIFRHDFYEIFNFTTYALLSQYQLLIQLKFLLFEFDFDSLDKIILNKNQEYEMPNLILEQEDEELNNLTSTQEHLHLSSDSDVQQISFFVRREDLVLIPSNSQLFEQKDYINNENIKLNFINPDMTGNYNAIKDEELNTIIQLYFNNEGEMRKNIKSKR